MSVNIKLVRCQICEILTYKICSECELGMCEYCISTNSNCDCEALTSTFDKVELG